MSILLVIVIFIAAGLLLWWMNKYLPAPWKWIGIGIILLALLWWFLTLIGLTSGINARIK
jgi:hypothetical protein